MAAPIMRSMSTRPRPHPARRSRNGAVALSVGTTALLVSGMAIATHQHTTTSSAAKASTATTTTPTTSTSSTSASSDDSSSSDNSSSSSQYSSGFSASAQSGSVAQQAVTSTNGS
jgi:hypothetical protein